MAAVNVLGGALPALAGPSAMPAEKSPIPLAIDMENGRSEFYFSAGWQWRETGGMEVRTGSRARQYALPRGVGTGRDIRPSIGSANEWADRFYTDGSVRIDAGTATDGTTSAWSYQHSSQIVGEALHFHAAGQRHEFDSGSSIGLAEDGAFDGTGGAPVIEVGWQRALNPTWTMGARFQWSFIDFEGTQAQSNFSAWQREQEYSIGFLDIYDLQGILVPDAPFEGGGQGFGPLIDNRPMTRWVSETRIDTNEVYFFNRIEHEFDIRLHSVSLGPMVSAQVGRVEFQGGIGLVLNVVDWKAAQEETLFQQRPDASMHAYRRWTDRRQDIDVLPGVYLQGGVSWQMRPRIFVSGFGRYDWSQSLVESFGASSLGFDPSGWSAGILIGLVFK